MDDLVVGKAVAGGGIDNGGDQVRLQRVKTEGEGLGCGGDSGVRRNGGLRL